MAKRRPSGDGMVRKRDDGRWEGRIVVGHKNNGAPIFQHVYARTQKELTNKLHQNIERYQDVELTEDSRMTLGEWLDRWLTEYKEGTIRHGTLQGYRSVIETQIKPSLGNKQVSLVTAQDVQRFYKKLKENGRVREHPQMGTQLSDTTVNRVHGILHQAMEDAVHAHVIAGGVDAKTLSGILGHTNASFTLDTYTHVTPDMQKAASNIVGSFMKDLMGAVQSYNRKN